MLYNDVYPCVMPLDCLNGRWEEGSEQEQRWPNFQPGEFASPDAPQLVWLSAELLTGLQSLRKLTGVPIHINSGYRTWQRNLLVGGKSESYHLLGMAADIRCNGLSPNEVADLAKQVLIFKEGGIGVYPTFTHVDVRPDGPSYWQEV